MGVWIGLEYLRLSFYSNISAHDFEAKALPIPSE